MSNEKEQKEQEAKEQEQEKVKFFDVFRLFKRNMVSLHHAIWGKGWKRFVLAIVVTLVVLLSLLMVTLEVTSTPRFCNTCHNMEPYYESWKKSSHKDVTCTDCHFPPGFESKIKGKFMAMSMLVNYFTGVYKRSKPWAEISDKSCMREGCHDTRLLAGEVGYKKKIKFNHEHHLTDLRRGKKLRCTSCHSQIVQGSHISVTETTCFLCHFKETEEGARLSQCTNCHNPPTAGKDGKEMVVYDHTEVLKRNIDCRKCHGQMVVGDGSVPKERCSVCHADNEKIKLYSDTTLMHQNHIANHKIECNQCHTDIQHKSVARSDFVKPDCHACHPDFHNAQLDLFTGKGGHGLPEHPSPMYTAGLNCQACHIYHQFEEEFEEKGETLLAKAESCEPCHGKGYSRVLTNWKTQTDRKIAQLTKVMNAAEKIVEAGKKSKGYATAREKLNQADFNFKLVKHGNSIHNISYANKLLEKADEFARTSVKEVGSKRKLPMFERETDIVPGECSNCHAGIERKVTQAFGWKFSHFVHLKGQSLTCNRCHSNERVHGQLIIEKQDCMKCHHKGIDEGKGPACNTCHKTQDSVYHSRIDFVTYKIPNMMGEDVGCLDCHQDEKGKLFRPGRAVCSKCHESDYEEMFDEWETKTINGLKKLREKVKSGNLGSGDRAYDVLMLLEKDGSRGIHNPELYEKLIEEALK